MKLFVFGCRNTTNIWAAIGARKWAVSNADPANMKGRASRIKNLSVGSCGIIYSSEGKFLTTPFLIRSIPNPEARENSIWPEEWRMPFDIHPLGTPRSKWDAYDALEKLPFNKDTGNKNIASVFKVVGTAVFSPIEIGEADWAMIITNLADGIPN